MNFIDTHTHIYSQEFDNDRPIVIKKSKEAGIKAILLPNEDSTSIDAINRLCDEEPSFAFPMIGLHPTSVKNNYTEELKIAESQLTKRQYAAIGEIGIDLYWDKTYLKEQKTVFEEQLKWSRDLDLPVSIHTRDGLNQAIDCIYKIGHESLKGIFHCFGGTYEEWLEIAKLETFYAGIGGVITYKKCNLSEYLSEIPLERVVLETDAPYLSPIPYRGKRNEPVYIIETAKKVAESYGKPLEEIARATFNNAVKMFNLPDLRICN
jgi:TatD DNase family protein